MLNSFRIFLTLTVIAVAFYNFYDNGQVRYPRAPLSVASSDFPNAFITPYSGSSINAGSYVNIQWPYYNGAGSAASLCLELWSQSSFVSQIKCFQTFETSFTWVAPFPENTIPQGSYSFQMFAIGSDGKRYPYAYTQINIIYVASDSNIQIHSPSQTSIWNILSNETISFDYYGSSSPQSWSAFIYSTGANSPVFYGQELVHLQTMNTRSFTFTVPMTWGIGNFVVVICVYGTNSGSCAMGDTFRVFVPANGYSEIQKSINVNVPATGQTVHKNESLVVSWSLASTAVSSYTVALINADTSQYSMNVVAQVSPDFYQITMPAGSLLGLPTSNLYFILVWGPLVTAKGDVTKQLVAMGFSGYFTIRNANEDDGNLLQGTCSNSDCNNNQILAISGNPKTVYKGGNIPGSGSGNYGYDSGTSPAWKISPNMPMLAIVMLFTILIK